MQLILDEADTLLDMGFRADIDAIADFLPSSPERQTFLFSATVSKAIQQIAKQILAKNHKFINCVPVDASPVHAHVPQYHTVLHNASQQIPHVLRLLAHDQLANPGASKTIVFLPTTKMTQLFATAIRELSKTSLPAGRNTHVYEIHSKRTMDARTNTSSMFRSDTSGASILISSDVSARGVDYPNVTRVIQVGIPTSPDQYIHRVGRTGRAGTKGRGDLVLLPWELHYVTTSLSDVSLKPLKYADLTEETTELGKKFDEAPREFFAQAPWTPPTATPIKSSRDRRTKMPVTGPAMFQSPVVATLETLESNITDLVGRLDEEGITETFMSLLGYYAPRAPEMRVTRDVMLEGLKQWSVEACGLSVPPHVSSAFLQKIGLGREQGDMGRNYRQSGYPPRRGGGPSWDVRGKQRANKSSISGGEYGEYRNGKSRDIGSFGDREGRSGYGRRSASGRDAFADGGRGGYSQSGRGEYGESGRGGYGRGGYGQGGRSQDGGRGGYSQGGREGYSPGDRGSSRGGYGGGRGREDRHKDAGESGYGLR
jgi:ATP-dependent RNA helicase MSS116, mitochondrial